MKLEKAQHFLRSANERALNLGRPPMRMATYNVENLFGQAMKYLLQRTLPLSL